MAQRRPLFGLHYTKASDYARAPGGHEPSLVRETRTKFTPKQVRRVRKIENSMKYHGMRFPHADFGKRMGLPKGHGETPLNIHIPKPHVPHVREPHLLGAHPMHSSHFHIPTGASLTPHVPHVHVDPIHLRIHPTRSLGSGIAHDIKKIGGSIERDVRKVERKVF